MRQLIATIALVCLPLTGAAQTVDIVVAQHILPGFDRLAQRSAVLAETAATDCSPTSAPLRAAYHDAFDAWVAVSHLRFGPTEVDDRAFALAFWPDSRGTTPKALSALIRDEDDIAASAAAYADMSIAARGFYAMEFLLYDDVITSMGSDAYRCQLVQTVAADIAAVAVAVDYDWNDGYADRLLSLSDTYRTDAEALQELFKALTAGLQFTSETRLGRPLGTFDKPRPLRAEARRSERSARHVLISLTSLRDLAGHLSENDPKLLGAFDRALAKLQVLDDPVFAGVDTPQSRLHVEIIQQAVDDIRVIAATELGPRLGVASGFNALDGD